VVCAITIRTVSFLLLYGNYDVTATALYLRVTLTIIRSENQRTEVNVSDIGGIAHSSTSESCSTLAASCMAGVEPHWEYRDRGSVLPEYR
jgi:hypothetical protein